jgi:methylthioribose-1-phosphate isomerase
VINRHQDSNSKRLEEFIANIQDARSSSENLANATPEIQEAAKNQAAFSERRKKHLGGK